MKITKQQLKRIIKEELENVLEGQPVAGSEDIAKGDDILRQRYDELRTKAKKAGKLSADEQKEWNMLIMALDPGFEKFDGQSSENI